MTEFEIESIFSAQTENVRELEKSWRQINLAINNSLVTNNAEALKLNTRFLGLLFCAYCEAQFSKLIHTPNQFSSSQIQQIKSQRSVVDSWKKCIVLAVSRVEASSSNHKPNLIKKLNSLIDNYIAEPSLIRNKIAHGQWVRTLNVTNTKETPDFSIKIRGINSIDYIRFKSAVNHIYRIIEDIVKSPNKTHHRDYWTHVSKFEETQRLMMSWTIEDKRKKLKTKKSFSKYIILNP